ncbi:MAG: hypothetical protein FWE10_05980 [Rikenellaceae bacterium]|nr:hypothetical protein [Rikenellaceae bacterium]MCL2692954.1 hypothetical protein [Rikenellaceae bacterium]
MAERAAERSGYSGTLPECGVFGIGLRSEVGCAMAGHGGAQAGEPPRELLVGAALPQVAGESEEYVGRSATLCYSWSSG